MNKMSKIFVVMGSRGEYSERTEWAVCAVYDETQPDEPAPGPQGKTSPTSQCWQPTPFIPWHQPFFNEAGVYHVRATLPCNRAVGACVVAPDLLVVSDDDGSQWIERGRVVARDWRPYAAARGDVILSTAGDAYRVRVRRAVSAG